MDQNSEKISPFSIPLQSSGSSSITWLNQQIKTKLSHNIHSDGGDITPVTPASPVGEEKNQMIIDSNDNKHNDHQYPLALEPTPSYLRSFRFLHNGVETIFNEDDNGINITVDEKSHSKSKKHSIDMNGIITPGNSAPLPKRYRVDEELKEEEEVEVVNNDVEEDNNLQSDDDLMISREIHGSPHMSLPSPSASPDTRNDMDDDDSSDGEMELALVKDVVGESDSISTLTTVNSTTTINNPLSDIFNSFDNLHPQLRRYALYNLLKKCDRTSLSIMSGIIVPALRCDFLTLLPNELAYNILSYLDHTSLCRAAQVSKSWKNIVDSSEWVWKSLLEKDDYGVTSNDYRKAVNERWDYVNWGSTSSSSSTPFSSSINIYKAIYRRKQLIHQNWMNPKSNPKHLQVRGHGHDVVTCLQFDDERIITGSDDNTINVYDTKTGQLRNQFTGHDGGVWALKYINKRTLISGATDRTVRVWDIEKGKCTHIFYGHTSTVRCLDIINPVPYTDKVTGQITYIPEEPIIVTGSRDATLRMWRLPTIDDEEYIPPIATDGHVTDPYFLRLLKGHTNSVRAISGYGDTIVSGSYDTTVRVWNVATGDCRWELTGHAQRVYSAVLDHKRNRCISGSMDWFVKVWCIETGSLLYTLEGHTSLVGLLDLNRTTLVSAAADSTLRVWDPETGAFLHKLQGHQGAITCFQHDENKVVSGSEKTLKLWDIRSGDLIRDLLTDLSGIWQVCFDERRCVAAVKRNEETYIEVLDFDYDPFEGK